VANAVHNVATDLLYSEHRLLELAITLKVQEAAACRERRLQPPTRSARPSQLEAPFNFTAERNGSQLFCVSNAVCCKR
jgi:hypothetical protein